MDQSAFAVPVRFVSSDLPNNPDAATAVTIARMEVLSTEAAQYMRDTARSIGCTSDVVQCADAVHRFARSRVRFVPDSKLAVLFGVGGNPDEAEILVRPDALLQMDSPRGDCDDFSMLAMALFKAAGVPASFATVAADERVPDSYSHVYVVAHGPGGDIPVDASHGKYAGWSVGNPFGKLKVWGRGMYWNTLNPARGFGLNGLGDYTDWLASVFGAGQGDASGNGSADPTYSATGTAQRPSLLQDLLRQGADTANYILKNRLSPPVLVKGADGSVTIRTPVGVDASTPYSSTAPQYQQPGTAPAANQLPSWALPVGVGVLALVLITSLTKKK